MEDRDQLAELAGWDGSDEPSAPDAPTAPEPDAAGLEASPAEPAAQPETSAEPEARVEETNEQKALKAATEKWQEAARLRDEIAEREARLAAKEQDERWRQLSELYEMVEKDSSVADRLNMAHSMAMAQNAEYRLENEVEALKAELEAMRTESIEARNQSEAQQALDGFASWYAETHPEAGADEVEGFCKTFLDDFLENGPEVLPENGKDVLERMQFHYFRTRGSGEMSERVTKAREEGAQETLKSVASARSKAPLTSTSAATPPEPEPPKDVSGDMHWALEQSMKEPTTDADFDFSDLS